MALHDYECSAHGVFDSMKENPSCPHGCSNKMVRKVFLKAPGVVSDGTKMSDNVLGQVADQHRLTNMSNRGGQSVLSQKNVTATQAVSLKESGISGTLSSMGLQGGNALKDAKPLMDAAKPKTIVTASWKG